MNKRYALVVLILTIALLFTSCFTSKEDKELEELNRLTSENILLNAELENLKNQNEKLTLDISTLKENIKLSKMSREEVAEGWNLNTVEILKIIESTDDFSDVFGFSFIPMTAQTKLEYGKIVFEKMNEETLEVAIKSLSEQNETIIELSTSIISDYAIASNNQKQMKKLINDYILENKLNEGISESYIVRRILCLIG